MLLEVLDANKDPVIICAQSQDAPTDRSGNIAAVNTSQALMGANANRSGWFVQNTGLNTTVRVNDIGGLATDANSVVLLYGQTFPPPGYPVTVGPIVISGDVAGATYSAREW